MKHKIALYIISRYNRWQNCWDAFLKRGVLWCPDKGTPHPSPLPQMVLSELNRTRQVQKQYKGKKVRWEQGIPPLFSLILSNFLPAPYYLYAWNRLISSLSFATQYLQTTRKRLYSDNSIQSSAYIKCLHKDLILLDLICLFVCLSWWLLLLMSHYRSCNYIVRNVLFQFKIVHIHAGMYRTFSMRPIYGPLAYSADKIFIFFFTHFIVTYL